MSDFGRFDLRLGHSSPKWLAKPVYGAPDAFPNLSAQGTSPDLPGHGSEHSHTFSYRRRNYQTSDPLGGVSESGSTPTGRCTASPETKLTSDLFQEAQSDAPITWK